MLTLGLAVVSILFALTLMPAVWRRNQFHPAIFFLLFAIVDVFFPAIYWTLFGQVGNPDWLLPLRQEKILDAVTHYSAFLFIFIACLLGVDGGKSPRLDNSNLAVEAQARLGPVLWVLLALTLAKIAVDVSSYGGPAPWFWSRLIFASVADADGAAIPGGGSLAALPARELFQAAVGLAFFYRKQLDRPWLFGVLFPIIAMGLAMATFLRGAVLACAITLIFAEVIRQKTQPRIQSNTKRSAGRVKFFAAAMIAIILSIYVYGSVRDSFRGLASSDEDTSAELAVPTFLTAGHGLLGLSHIVAEYGQSVNFLWGQTYVDMLLLPIPRSIYSSKPFWYGVDDITRGMGWPESTQSAVTMPGEAFANFGLLGLLIAIPLGIAFGWLQRLVRSNPVRFLLLGPTVFFQIVAVASWMSFTGIMNAVPSMALLFVLAAYIGKGRPKIRYTRLTTQTPIIAGEIEKIQ